MLLTLNSQNHFESTTGVHVFPILNPPPTFHLPPHSIPLGHPSAPSPSTLSHALNLDWRFVSHMIIYMFQYVHPWWIHVNVWQNHYNKKKRKKFKKHLEEEQSWRTHMS